MQRSKFIIALDPSKHATGVCVLRSTEGEIEVLLLDTIRIPDQAKINKYYFCASMEICKAVSSVIDTYQLRDKDVSVALEYPVFQESSSELQFHLHQALLEELYVYGIDCVGYSVPFLKSFIRQASYLPIPDFQPRKQLTKEQIEWVYRNCTWPLNTQELPDPNFIKTSDEYDALYLALLAAWIQVPFLERITRSTEDILSGLAFPDFISTQLSKQVLLQDPSHWGKLFKAGEGDIHFHLKNVKFGIDTSTKVQFKALIAAAKKNNHLSTLSTFFYPFSKITNCQNILNFYLSQDRESVLEYLTVRFKSRKSWLDEMLGSTVKLAFAKNGSMFIRRPAKLQGSIGKL